jgi:hypothetical protein
MPLFRKTYDFRNDALGSTKDRFHHLERLVQPGRAIARAPEMKNDGTTVVLLPQPDFDKPDYREKGLVLPDRRSAEEANYNPWLFYGPGVQRFGKNPVSLLFDDPDDAGFNPWDDHPVFLIYGALKNAKKNQLLIETPFGSSDSDRWTVLLDGDSSGPRAVYSVIKRPETLILAHALVYSSGPENYHSMGAALGSATNDLPVVFVMTSSTGETLSKAVDAPRAGIEIPTSLDDDGNEDER